MKNRRLSKLLCTSLIAATCLATHVNADTVGIDSLDTSNVVKEDEPATVEEDSTIRQITEDDGNGPKVINQDEDDYYPNAEVEVVTEESTDELVQVVVDEEMVEETDEEQVPFFESSDIQQTGIPSLDQYVNVPESENTRWRIPNTSEESFKKSFEAYISSGTIRLEVFYTASADMPDIVFTSSGGNKYSMVEGSKNLGKTIFKVRNGYSVSDYPDIKYSIIYISDAEDPGTWKIDINLNQGIKEFAFLTTEIPDNWESLDTDYKTQPKDLLLWYWSEKGVDETEASSHTLEDFIRMMRKDSEIPGTNNINSTEVKKEIKKTNPLSGFFTMLIIIIVAGVAGVVYVLSKLYKQNAGMISNRIIVENKKMSLRKKKADSQVDEIMLADGEMDSYFTFAKKEESTVAQEDIVSTVNSTIVEDEETKIYKTNESSEKEGANEAKEPAQESVTELIKVEKINAHDNAVAEVIENNEEEIDEEEDFF